MFQADLLDLDALSQLVCGVINKFGRLDALVNNASSFYATSLADMNEQQWNDLLGTNLRAPLFAVNAGDNVDVDEPAQWRVFNARTAALSVPLFTTIGNHDSYVSTKLYRKNLGDLFYGFTVLDAQFLFLDNAQLHNNATLNMDGRDPGAQWSWFEQQVRQPAVRRFAFFHFPMRGNRSMLEPMYTIGTPAEERLREVNRLMLAFRDAGVDAVYFGHIHSPERSEEHGVDLVRLGGGGGSRASQTQDRDVSFVHVFVDENEVRDYTVFLYGDENIERIEFCEMRAQIPAGSEEPVIVHGLCPDKRLVAVDADIRILSGPGRMQGSLYQARGPGRATIEASTGPHVVQCSVDVI